MRSEFLEVRDGIGEMLKERRKADVDVARRAAWSARSARTSQSKVRGCAD